MSKLITKGAAKKVLKVKKIAYGGLSYIYAVGFGTIGFVVTVLRLLSASFQFGEATNSLLAGMAFGLTAGVLGVLLGTALYALIGAFVGFVNAAIINYLLGATDGLGVTVEND